MQHARLYLHVWSIYANNRCLLHSFIQFLNTKVEENTKNKNMILYQGKKSKQLIFNPVCTPTVYRLTFPLKSTVAKSLHSFQSDNFLLSVTWYNDSWAASKSVCRPPSHRLLQCWFYRNQRHNDQTFSDVHIGASFFCEDSYWLTKTFAHKPWDLKVLSPLNSHPRGWGTPYFP